MITQETKLNLIPGGAPPIVHVSQYDVGRTLTFGLVAGSETFNVPAGTTAQIVGTKPDKKGFEYGCTVDRANSTVSVTVEEQMTAVAGNTICEIRLMQGGANIGTANFVLRVEQAALSEETDISETVLPDIIAGAQAQADAAAASATEAAGYAEDAQDTLDELREEVLPENIQISVDNWLDDHPEATTTVQDHSLGVVKLTDAAVAELKDTASVIFMPSGAGEQNRGDCTVFVSANKKQTVMIDSGSTDAYTGIKAELTADGITHVDYFILTHYHSDHYGNIRSLISDGFIDAETVFYMPRSYSLWASVETTVKGWISGNTIITADRAETLTVDGMKFSFFNCDQTDIDHYQGSDNINNYSVCNFVEIQNTRILMTGDIEEEAEEYLVGLGDIKQCDILKYPHHMVERDVYQGAYIIANPTYAVAPQTRYAYTYGIARNSGALKCVGAMGGKSYIAGDKAVRIGVGYNVYALYPNGGEIFSNQADKAITLYVDSTYTGEISDGSQTKPFKTLQAAIERADVMETYLVRISFLTTYTSDETVSILSSVPKIAIDACTVGEVIVRNSDVDLTAVTATINTDDEITANQNEGWLRKNLLRATGAAATSGGRTFTPQADGGILCTGTATGNSSYDITTALALPPGEYVLDVSGFGTTGNGGVYVGQNNNKETGSDRLITKAQDGHHTIKATKTVTNVWIYITGAEYDLSGQTLYVQIRPVGAKGGEYTPYTQSNRELQTSIDAITASLQPEYGDWTPVFVTSTAPSGVAFTATRAKYVRHGKIVFLHVYGTFGEVTDTGALYIPSTSLPVPMLNKNALGKYCIGNILIDAATAIPDISVGTTNNANIWFRSGSTKVQAQQLSGTTVNINIMYVIE